MDRAKKRDVAIPALESVETLERLKALVREHRICWEVWPERMALGGATPLQIGFDLVLTAPTPTMRIDLHLVVRGAS